MTGLEPLHELRLRTPRLDLRLGSHEELLALGSLAKSGIHPPEEMPFAVAWTDRTDEPAFVDDVASFHEERHSSWEPSNWSLSFLVWEDEALTGTQELSATRFAERRTVRTGSWLGRAFQARGIGTEMRAAVLELAFRGLGALRAESGWLAGNDASRRVSEKLGYVETAVDTMAPRGVQTAHHWVAVERAAWHCPVPVEITGLEPCLPLFGVSAPARERP